MRDITASALQVFQQALQNTPALLTRQSTPPGMGTGHPLTCRITQKHRQTIGNQNGTSHWGIPDPRGISD
jgi:hypothetical protein